MIINVPNEESFAEIVEEAANFDSVFTSISNRQFPTIQTIIDFLENAEQLAELFSNLSDVTFPNPETNEEILNLLRDKIGCDELSAERIADAIDNGETTELKDELRKLPDAS